MVDFGFDGSGCVVVGLVSVMAGSEALSVEDCFDGAFVVGSDIFLDEMLDIIQWQKMMGMLLTPAIPTQKDTRGGCSQAHGNYYKPWEEVSRPCPPLVATMMVAG